MSTTTANLDAKRTVDRDQLERSLAKVKTRVANPAHGIHGPGTISWEIGRENVLFLGGGCAALLQLAHPAVASAISRHSKTQQDAWGRFFRTFRNVWAMAFGDLDAAFAAARRVHAVHERVFGRLEPGAGAGPEASYAANQPEALLWVHVTLVETSIQVFDLVVRRLSSGEKDAFVRESLNFALLFGIPPEIAPPDYRQLSRYFQQQVESDRIAAWKPARRIADFLMQPPLPGTDFIARWYRNMTAGLLPPGLREGFGFEFGPRERERFDRWATRMRRILPYLPGALRFLPAYHSARRRVARAGSLSG